MSGDPKFHIDLSMDDIMNRWPETIHVLIKHKMHCVGCVLAPFHSATDAVGEHKGDANTFFADLYKATGRHN